MRTTRPRSVVALAISIVGVFSASTVEVLGRTGDERPAVPQHAPAGQALAAEPSSPPPLPARPSTVRSTRRAVTRGACGASGAPVLRYRVTVEPGVGVTLREAREVVRAVLCDRRGWSRGGGVRFVEDARGANRISIRSSSSTERRCSAIIGRPAGSYFSCASDREAVLNAARWRGGSRSWDGAIDDYRRLLVNHEVGHVLGMRHRGCSGSGDPAPVMMQQSKGLHGCLPNPWPTAAEVRALRFRG